MLRRINHPLHVLVLRGVNNDGAFIFSIMGKRKREEEAKVARKRWRKEIGSLLSKGRFKEFACERYPLSDLTEPAIVCQECETVVFDDYCEDCFFRCKRCGYYFKKRYTEKIDDVCIFCLEAIKELDEIPDVKQPEEGLVVEIQ